MADWKPKATGVSNLSKAQTTASAASVGIPTAGGAQPLPVPRRYIEASRSPKLRAMAGLGAPAQQPMAVAQAPMQQALKVAPQQQQPVQGARMAQLAALQGMGAQQAQQPVQQQVAAPVLANTQATQGSTSTSAPQGSTSTSAPQQGQGQAPAAEQSGYSQGSYEQRQQAIQYEADVSMEQADSALSQKYAALGLSGSGAEAAAKAEQTARIRGEQFLKQSALSLEQEKLAMDQELAWARQNLDTRIQSHKEQMDAILADQASLSAWGDIQTNVYNMYEQFKDSANSVMAARFLEDVQAAYSEGISNGSDMGEILAMLQEIMSQYSDKNVEYQGH